MVQQHSAKEVSPAITSPITASSPCFAVIIANPTSGSYIYHARQIEEHVSFLDRKSTRLNSSH